MKYNLAIKRFIKASTPKMLEIAMLKNNNRRGIFFKYDNIQQSKNGEWYAWYLDERNDPIAMAKELNDATEN